MPRRIIQPCPAQTETLSCPKLLVCSKVHYQQLHLSQSWMVEGEILNVLAASEELGKMHLPKKQFVRDEASPHCTPFSLDEIQLLLAMVGHAATIFSRV